MLRAVHSFRPEKGNLFQTYASRVSENAMMDYIRKCVSAIPTTGQMLSLDIEPYNDPDNDESSFYDRLFSEYTKTPEQIYIEKETYEEVHHALDMLSPMELTYLRYRYGFNDDLLHDRADVKQRIEGGGNGGLFSETMPPRPRGRICESTLLAV